MNNIFFKSNLSKFIYFIFPPIILLFIKKLTQTRKKDFSDDEISYIKLLNNIEATGMDYFIDKSLIKRFCEIKKESYFKSEIKPMSDKKLQKNLDELVDNGFTIVKNIFNNNELEKLRSRFIPLAESGIETLRRLRIEHNAETSSKVIEENKDGIKILHNLYDGVSRFRGIETIAPEINGIGLNTDIHNICKNYLGGIVSPSNSYLDVKGVVEASDSSLGLHGDSYTKICKVFIALEDITNENAPFLYFAKSHKQGKWRLFKDLLEFSNINSEYHDYYSMYNILSMFKVSEEDNGVDIKPQRICLKAGDAIIADTSGIHGATDLLSGRRVQLGLVYEQRGLGASDKYLAV